MHSVGSTLSLAGNKRVTNQILSLSHLPDPGRKECSFVTSSSFLILENMFQSSLYDKLVNILSKEAIGDVHTTSALRRRRGIGQKSNNGIDMLREHDMDREELSKNPYCK